MNIAVTSPPASAIQHQDMANALRFLAIDAVEKANSGHPGMPMGMADVAAVLFTKFLNFDPVAPHWPDRDRFVLSAGHGSMLLYALLYLTGYPDMTLEQIKCFRQWGSLTPGHPEYRHTKGVETTTGPLGQGLATAVGMALAERLENARHGDQLVDHFTYVISGDGCLMEGLSHEAISLAGHLQLAKLIVLFDDNSISIDGATSLSCSDDQLARFAASNWDVARIDGHDPAAIETAIAAARKSCRPSLIACKTIIGFGAPARAGTEKVHGAPLGAAESAGARKALNWPHAPFEVPEPVLSAWRATAKRGRANHEAWVKRVLEAKAQVHFGAGQAAKAPLPASYDAAIAAIRAQFAASAPKIATRQASQLILDAIVPACPALIGGSADLTHSNLTHAKGQKAVVPGDFSGSYIHYGIREFGMSAAMNGIALHGGMIPYGGTFFVFSDYSRPAIRLAALMGVRAIHVMTHDSIGLGEDGPTHQPVEHLTAMRAIPNLNVFRPADAVETAEAWDCAMRADDRPSILCLSRQALPTLRLGENEPNKTAQGAYVLIEPATRRDVTLIATGSEVSLAIVAAKQLGEAGIHAAVVSAPCLEIFARQPAEYRRAVLGQAPRIGIEAGLEGAWPKWLGDNSAFIGMTGFGASAPAEVLYREFGITAEAVVKAARALIN